MGTLAAVTGQSRCECTNDALADKRIVSSRDEADTLKPWGKYTKRVSSCILCPSVSSAGLHRVVGHRCLNC
jgi:hypothetical protein